MFGLKRLEFELNRETDQQAFLVLYVKIIVLFIYQA